MGWANALSGILERYSGAGGGTAAAPENVHQDFQQAAQAAPQEVVAKGIAHAFQSDQTPSFPEQVAHLFGHSDPNQRAGLLNRLLQSAGPEIFAAIPGLSGLQGLLGEGAVSPQQASQVSPGQVQQIAAHAEHQNPSVVDEVSRFYAQHPDAMKALGGLALTIALQHMLKHR